MVEVSLTVGKLDASLALLLTKDHHLIEFPTILLPNGVKAGSIVKIKCDQDFETEIEEAKQFQSIQDEILNTFGKNIPKSPHLKVKNITQTSCILEWDKLELGTSSLKNLVLFKDGKKLGSIPQPMTNRTTKLSGLPIDKLFNFQLRLDTTAGIYSSNLIEVTTHKMTDLTGITVCLGDFSPNDQFTRADIEQALKNMGANFPPQDKIKVDTTHFICTRENKQNPEFLKASDMNIPIIRPEWLKACERERRIVGVRDFYVKDCVLPDIFAKNYWNSPKETNEAKETKEPTPVESKGELPALPETVVPEVKVEGEKTEPEGPEEVVEPKEQEPKEQEPKEQEPKEQEPKEQELKDLEEEKETVEKDIQPVTETKETGEVRLTEEPVTEESVTEEPVTEKKEVSEPTVEEPKVEEPKVEEPKVEEQAIEQPVAEPVTEPVAEPIAEPVVEPVAETVTEEPKDLTEEPKDLTEEPVIDSKNITEEPNVQSEKLDEINLELNVNVSAPPETEEKLDEAVDAEAEGDEAEGDEAEDEGDGENEENSPSPSSPSKKKKKNKKKKSKK